MHPKNSKYTLYDWEGVRPPGGVSSPSGRCPPLGGACHPIWRGVSFDLEGIRPPEGVSTPNHTPTVLARPSKWAVPPTWRGYAPWGAYPLPIIQILFRALAVVDLSKWAVPLIWKVILSKWAVPPKLE